MQTFNEETLKLKSPSAHLSPLSLFTLQAELKALQEMASMSFQFAQDLIKHNQVVFRSGEGALQVLPPLIDVIPEARLNLVIYFLKQGDHKLPCHTLKSYLQDTAIQWCAVTPLLTQVLSPVTILETAYFTSKQNEKHDASM